MKKNERTGSPINQKLADAMMSVLKVIHAPNHTCQVEPELLERQRKHQDILGKMVTPPLGFSWEPFDLNGLPMAWVRPGAGPRSRSGNPLLSRWRLHQRKPGLCPGSGGQNGQCDRI